MTTDGTGLSAIAPTSLGDWGSRVQISALRPFEPLEIRVSRINRSVVRFCKTERNGHEVPKSAHKVPDESRTLFTRRSYTLRRLDRDNDYEFRLDGISVGRTYLQSTPIGKRWYWSIYGINLRGPIPPSISVQGQVMNLEEAKEVFRRNFEKLMEAGNVKPELRRT